MKKLILLLLIVLFCNTTKTYAHTLPDSEYIKVSSDGILLQSQDAPGAAVKKNYEAYEKVPESVKKFLQRHHYHIYLCNEKEERPESGKYLGMTYFTVSNNSYKLYTDIYCCDREPEDVSTLLHEMGHALDYVYSSLLTDYNKYYMVSEDKLWLYYYKKYITKIAVLSETSLYNVYNESEAWAECFCYTILEPEKVEKNMPEVYKYVQNTVTSVDEYLKTHPSSKQVVKKKTKTKRKSQVEK